MSTKIPASLVLLSLVAVAAQAQTATGTITGNIIDSTGAVIPGARVTLTDQGTNQAREQTSNEAGLYEFRALPRGVYSLQVEKSGFRKERITSITLQVAQSERLDVTLQLGEVTESVTVEAAAGLVQAADANLSQVIDEQRLRQLPLNGRNFMQLTFLSSGVITAGRASATQRQANYGPAFSVGGQRDNTSVVLVDGIEISGQELNNYAYAIPSLDSLTEFRVQTSGYSAEFGGNSGAIINVASKRGTNQFHGALFEFLRNDALDARNFFATTVAPNKRNQFGYVLSGPVLLPKIYDGRNKTFWMFSWEWTRQRNASTSTTLVPNERERAGDFSGVRTPGFLIVEPFSKTPLPNNIVPTSLIDPVGKRLVELFPPPNFPDPNRNFIGAPLRRFNVSVPAFRIDHQLRHNNLFGRATINEPNDRGPGQSTSPGFPYEAINVDRHVQYSLGDTYTISPTVVNELNAGFVRMRRDRTSADSFHRNWIEELGIRGVPTQPLTWGAPAVDVSGYTQAGFSTNNAYLRWITQAFQIVDNLSKIHGSHTFKLGGNFQKKQLNSTQWGAPNGNYSFTGVYTSPPPVTTTDRFTSLADALFGFPSSYTVQAGPFLQRFRNNYAAFYFQDDWRTTPNLTLNIGMRWEYFGKPLDLYDRIATFDLRSGRQILAGQEGVPRNLIDADKNNFGPRFGFAWRALGSEKLVVRGAYGIYYSPAIANDFRNIGFQDPFAAQNLSRPYRPENPTSPLPVFTAKDPTLGANRVTNLTRAGVDRHFRDAYIQQWNFSIQRLLTTNTLFEAAYRGSKSTRLATRLNYNEQIPNPAQPPDFKFTFPYPDLAAVSMLESRGAANYHALTARLEKRYANGFTFLANYTFSKTLTDIDGSSVGIAIGAGPSGPNTIKNLRANKGPSVFDRPHQLSMSTLYELPFLKNRKDLLRTLAGGWQVGAIATMFTGAYLTPSQFGAQNTGSRPDLLGNPNLPRSERTIDRWFDVSKLQNAQPGTFGNSGKGVIQGSGNNLWNIVAAKNFRITETHKLQFRAEFFNAFNHPQFDDPNMFPATHPLAGKVTSASDFGFNQTERVIQFGLKYDF